MGHFFLRRLWLERPGLEAVGRMVRAPPAALMDEWCHPLVKRKLKTPGGLFLSVISLRFAQDEEMVLKLMGIYEAGLFGQTALSQITFLAKTDLDGKHLIDTGLSSCTAVYRLWRNYLDMGDVKKAHETLIARSRSTRTMTRLSAASGTRASIRRKTW